MRQLLDIGDEFLERPPTPRESEHPRDLADGDLDADAGEEADEHRAREEVREEPKADEPGDEQDRGGDQRQDPARATYCGEPVAANPARPAAMIAAVAESAPTTRWRDDPKRANSAIGMRMV